MSHYLRFSRSLALSISILLSRSLGKSTTPTTRNITKKPIVSVCMLFIVVVLGGCVSGSALVTGQTRPAIEDHTTVAILTEMPDGSDPIAIVKASSDSGWTEQRSLDQAVDELKKQAAKVGANAVVLAGRDTSTQTVGFPADGGGTLISSLEKEIVQGTAIWVD